LVKVAAAPATSAERFGKVLRMPRRARGPVPAGVYHVTTRSAGPIAMFVDDFDRTLFCNLLARVVRKRQCLCHAFVLMTTHFHLLLEVEDNVLQPGMQTLNGPYAQRFNARHRRSGHLRGDRYFARVVESDGHMLNAFRYIVRNPVEAGLCARPSDWIWGSYRGCVGLEKEFPFVNSSRMRAYFAPERDAACALLRELCDDVVTDP
jgi:putative transposase